MAHEVHTTEAIVIDSADIGEADKLYWLLTKEYGFITATARSVRKEESKLRYALRDFSVVEVSLVRGKSAWRVTGASLCMHVKELPQNVVVVFGRITSLVRRMVPTDDVSVDIWSIVYATYCELLGADTKRAYCIEITAVLRVLSTLGYIREADEYAAILRQAPDVFVGIDYTPTMVQSMTAAINNALHESQL